MKVWYTTIWDSGKNYGGYINSFCELVPPDDWICITDGDVMFLTDDFGKQIEDIIDRNGHIYDVFGATMNRLGGVHQLADNRRCEVPDILYHMGIARTLWDVWKWDVKPSIKPIAAACMFFSRKTWEKTRFIEKSPRFDSDFCRRIQQKGGKLAICKGLYVFHKYRLGDPTLSPNHLL